jgi:hypothetical protein
MNNQVSQSSQDKEHLKIILRRDGSFFRRDDRQFAAT